MDGALACGLGGGGGGPYVRFRSRACALVAVRDVQEAADQCFSLMFLTLSLSFLSEKVNKIYFKNNIF